MPITRRVFLRNGAFAAVGTAAVPSFLTRAVYASPQDSKALAKRLVVIFQRGAADGLNIVVPHGEPAYYTMRPTINIPCNSVLDLDGFFGLHPATAPLQHLWDERHLAIVHAAGLPDPTRSHFDAQDFMESGTPGVKATEDGWLNRALNFSSAQDRTSPFRAIALSPSLPRILSGGQPATALSDIHRFRVGVSSSKATPISNMFEGMYVGSVDTVLHGAGKQTFEAVKMLKSADPTRYKSAKSANYPQGHFSDSLRQLAQLIKANLGVQVAFAEIGGWDHHVDEGNTQGQLANVLHEFSESLSAFWIDLGDLAEDTVLIAMSEFGRTARENANRGTDHGHANAMFVLGGRVNGGKVYGQWPGLDQSQLYEGRDLAVTTDFRRVLGEALDRHLGNSRLDTVFPGFTHTAEEYLKFLG